MAPDPAPAGPPAVQRGWATSTLVAGLVWLVFATLPTFVTTIMGLPIGLYAVVAGWIMRRRSLRREDRTGARRAAWGFGLGCAGFVWLSAFYIFVGGVAVAGLVAVIQAAMQGTPAP